MKRCENIPECIRLQGKKKPEFIDPEKCPKQRLSGTISQACFKVVEKQ